MSHCESWTHLRLPVARLLQHLHEPTFLKRIFICIVQDEFGKGTNAQDGIALLYACLQHFLDLGLESPKVLACTHYTELTEVPEFRNQAGTHVYIYPESRTDDKKNGYIKVTLHVDYADLPPPFQGFLFGQWK